MMTAALADMADGSLDIPALYDAHATFVGRVIRRLTHEGTHVDELLQETFIVAFQKRDEFLGRSSVRTWLYGIARHLCLRHIRSQRRFFFFQSRFVERQVNEPQVLPLEETLRRESIARVQRVLDALPFEQREIIVLHELEGMEGADIAESTGLPIGTVWTRLRRARLQIEKTMKRERLGEKKP